MRPSLNKAALVAIRRLPAAVAADLETACAQPCRGNGFADPGAWRPATWQFNCEALADACAACSASGVALDGLGSLGGVDAVDAFLRLHDEGRWSPQNVTRVLCIVRRFLRIAYGEAPAFITVRLNHWKALPRSRRRATVGIEEAIAGAVSMAAAADLFEAAAKTDTATRLRCDAALLAGAAELNARRSEYASCSRRMVQSRSESGKEVLEVVTEAADRKNKKPRIGVISDARAIALIRAVAGCDREGPLFPSGTGGAMTVNEVGVALRRACLLAIGKPACPNDFRDAGASLYTDPQKMARRIGNNPATAVKSYRQPMAKEGLPIVREGLLSRGP